MQLFNKLPGFTPSPPGLERTVLRCIPGALTGGLAALMLPSLLLRLSGRVGWHSAEAVTMTDIYALGGVLFYCSLVFVCGLAAFIVMLMKGPAYAADAYPVPDADAPAVRPPASP